jgi:general secretion pathway protein D
MNSRLRQPASFWTALLLLAVFPCSVQAQVTGAAMQNAAIPAQPAQNTVSTTAPAQDKQIQNDQNQDVKPIRNADRRRAAKLYLAAGKLFEKGEFERALHGYEQAAKLDPSNRNYPLAASVARSHAVTALIQAAAKDRLRGDQATARAALARSLELEPRNTEANEHLYELGNDALLGQLKPLYEQGAEAVGGNAVLESDVSPHSFHLHSDQRQIIRQIFRAYGIETTLDNSVRPLHVRLDMDNVSFNEAARILQMLTKTFYVPLDAHRVLVASDTKSNRDEFMRQELETISLSGLTQTEMTDVSNLAKNVFDVREAAVDLTAGTLTLRAPSKTLNAFNATMRELLQGKSQVLLQVRIIQLARTRTHDTGVELPQSISAFNLYTEEQSILNDNATTVQEIISSGLASSTDYLAILAILIAAGDVSSTLFSSGLATFGGGITESALSPGTVTANLSLNSSESRELDDLQLRLGDGEAATLRSGTRYPIQTSSYSDIASSTSTIAGLTSAGTSSSLASLLASYTSSSTIPQIEYQDLGLTLKATPRVLRNDTVALTLDMEIKALSGSSISDNPILDNNSYSGVVTLKQGETVMLMSNLSKTESRAVSGTPGISEIPGLNNMTGKDTEKNYATLLIVITPHVIRSIQAAGHTPMIPIDREQSGR